MLHKLRAALGRRPGQLLKGRVEADEAFVGDPAPAASADGRPPAVAQLDLVQQARDGLARH